MKILDGKKYSGELLEELAALLKDKQLHPTLTVIQIGDNQASNVYINNKRKACEKVGIIFNHVKLPEDVTQKEFEYTILGEQDKSTGIMVQLPISKHLDWEAAKSIIDPYKDVDGCTKDSMYIPCTPKGIMKLLHHYDIPLSGRNAVVVGRSDIVGKPMAKLLLQADCTVTVCHSKTDINSLEHYTQYADIVVCAVGKPNTLRRSMLRPDAVIVDVGINRDKHGKLCGDIEQRMYWDSPLYWTPTEGYYTPVPGGVGPMTIAALIDNVVEAALKQR